MPKSALLFARSVVILGSGVAIAALVQWSFDSPSTFLLCLALTVLGSTFKVGLPGVAGAISPNLMPILFAIGKLSWQESVIIAGVAGVTQCLWRPKQNPTVLQVLFNGANLAVSAAMAHWVSSSLAEASSLLMFLVAAVVYQLVNALSVATVLSLLEAVPTRALWRNIHLWSFPYALASGGFAGIWASAIKPAGYSTAVICAVVLYLMNAFCEEIANRTVRASVGRLDVA